ICPRREKSPAAAKLCGANQEGRASAPRKAHKGRDMKIQHWAIFGAIGLGALSASASTLADGNSTCSGLPSQAALESALDGAVNAAGNGGLGFNMWGDAGGEGRHGLRRGIFGLPVHRP